MFWIPFLIQFHHNGNMEWSHRKNWAMQWTFNFPIEQWISHFTTGFNINFFWLYNGIKPWCEQLWTKGVCNALFGGFELSPPQFEVRFFYTFISSQLLRFSLLLSKLKSINKLVFFRVTIIIIIPITNIVFFYYHYFYCCHRDHHDCNY